MQEPTRRSNIRASRTMIDELHFVPHIPSIQNQICVQVERVVSAPVEVERSAGHRYIEILW